MSLNSFKKLLNNYPAEYLYSNFGTYFTLCLSFFFLGLLSSKIYYFFYYFLKYRLKLLLLKLLKFKNKGDSTEEEDEEYKLVLCVRTDLSMGKGKIAAQCGHASIGAYTDSLRNRDPYVEKWFNEGQRKVVLKINVSHQTVDTLSNMDSSNLNIQDYDELKELKREARMHNINAHVTRDAGRTQIPSGSCTVIAIGPGPDKILNKITGHLKLL